MWLNLLTGSSTLLPKLVAIATITSTLAGGGAWVYHSIKAKGAAELQATITEQKYTALQKATGEAITRLNEQYARQINAANARRSAGEADKQRTDVIITDLKKDLEDAKKNDKCIDTVIPAARADRVRQLSKEAGSSAP